MKPIKQRPLNLMNTCNCIVDVVLLQNAILWYAKFPVTKNKKIFLYGFYPAIAIYKEKIHVHRLLMMYKERRILSSNEYVHHKNENKLDAMINNLQLMSAEQHQSLTNKGRKLTAIHKCRIGTANKKRLGMKYKKVIYENPELVNA